MLGTPPHKSEFAAADTVSSKRTVWARTIIAGFFSLIMLWNYSASFNADKGLDFRMFYSAAQILRAGHGRTIYDLTVQRHFQAQSMGEVGLVFDYPPPTALLYLPVAFFKLRTAYVLWTTMSMALFAGCVFLIHRSVQPFRDGFWTYLLSFLFLPVHITFLQGQVDIVLLVAYVLAFVSLKSGKDFLFGLALSVGLFKFHLVIPFVGVLLLRRQWRSLGGFGLGTALFTLSSAVISGWSFLSSYPRVLLHLKDVQRSGYNPGIMANVHGFLSFVSHTEPSLWIVISTSAVVFLLTVICWRKDEFGFCAVVVMTLITSFHLNPHDVVLLILPLFVAIRNIDWRSMEGAIVLSIGIPLLPGLLLSSHAFSLMVIPIGALLYFFLKHRGIDGPGTNAANCP